jgi:hypothetical protein
LAAGTGKLNQRIFVVVIEYFGFGRCAGVAFTGLCRRNGVPDIKVTSSVYFHFAAFQNTIHCLHHSYMPFY